MEYLEITCGKKGVISYKTIQKYDLSDGEFEEAEKRKEEEKRIQELKREEEIRLHKEQIKKKREREEQYENSKTSIEVQAMF